MRKFFLTFFCLYLLSVNHAQSRKVTVAKDGTGDFTLVQDAIDHISGNNNAETILFIKKGVYREKLVIDSSKINIRMIGEDEFNTILTYDDHTGKVTAKGDTINTRNSYSVLIKANHFIASHISFQNDAGFTAGQAVAAEVQGDQIIFDHCRFIGFQDVLFTNNDNSREYYANCYIEGTTDFIFGSATALFDHCTIYSKKNSHITAASTPEDHEYGYVFMNCILTADTALHNVSLGRPWRPFANVVYLHCYLDKHIKREGWANWNNTDNYKTVRYAEYKNYGPGVNTNERVHWSKQLNDEEVKKYSINLIFKNWNPLASLK